MKALMDRLVFTDLGVTFVYGFALHAPEGQPLEPKEPLLDELELWTPAYRLAKQIHYFERVKCCTSFPKKIKIVSPSNWGEIRAEFTADLTIEAAFRPDGFGCITLSFDCDENKKPEFQVEDLLALLLLSPRRLELGEDGDTAAERSQMYVEDRPLWKYLQKPTQKLSDAFLLCEAAVENLVKEGFEVEVNWRDKEEKGLYGNGKDGLETDPQIPYSVISAIVPQELYRRAFLEMRHNVAAVREARKAYTKDIAAILARWLVPQNVPHVSLDYWEARGLVTDGFFRNMYMNSLNFVTFSGQVSLLLRQENPERKKNPKKELLDPDEQPQRSAKNSILRCMEIARTRWHHALSLNNALDQFIDEVIVEQGTRDLLQYFSRLRKLKKSIAVHLEDPFVYLWDATLGSQISEFLRQNIMESIEESVLKKLTLVKEILLDLLDEAKTKEFAKILDRK